jgi:hypothetical protein
MFLLGGTLLALVAVLVLAILVRRAEEEFVELRDPNQIRQILEKQGNLKTEVSISEFQRERLYDTIVQLLFLYRDGDWEKFLGYLQERRGAFNSERLKGFREMFATTKYFDEAGRKTLAEIARHFQKWPPQEDVEVFRASWLFNYNKAGVWDAIAPKTVHIRIFQSEQPIDVGTAMGVIRTQSQQAIVFSRQTIFPGEKQAPCLYAEIRFRARHPTEDPPWRYFLWLRWDETTGNWFLDVAGMDFSAPRSSNTNLSF